MHGWLLWWALLGAGVTILAAPAAVGDRRRTLAICARQLRFAWADQGAGGARGPAAEQAVLVLVARIRRASGAFLTCFGGAMLVLTVGPALSTSRGMSIGVAALYMGAAIIPLLMVHRFLRPLVDESSEIQRDSAIDDYLSPLARVVVWWTAVGMLGVPVMAVVAARSSAFDGGELWWEGLVGIPLSVVAVVVVVELGSRRLRDSAAQPGMLHLWDVLRANALGAVLSFTCVVAVTGWLILGAGLHGVALTAEAEPTWVHLLWRITRTVALLQAIGGLVLLTQRWRFRRRLWPSHDLREPIPL